MGKTQRDNESPSKSSEVPRGRERGRPHMFRKGSSKAQHRVKVSLTRKEMRKTERRERKAKKHEFILIKTGVKVPENPEKIRQREKQKKKRQAKRKAAEKIQAQVKRGDGGQSDSESDDEVDFRFPKPTSISSVSAASAAALKLKTKETELAKEMQEVRKKRLLEENEEEDRYINMLSKRLKLNKKAIVPASFREDGLDYLLEICDTAASKKTQSKDAATSKSKNKNRSRKESDTDENDEYSEDADDGRGDEQDEDEGEDENIGDFASEDSDIGNEDKDSQGHYSSSENDEEMNGTEWDLSAEAEAEKSEMKTDKKKKKKSDGVWEDIYGRLRGSDGKILDDSEVQEPVVKAPATGVANIKSSNKYIPPMRRVDQTNREKIKKSLKGLLNRLAESNMHSIARQIEDMYMTNSRNEMNESILELYSEALIKTTLMPERIILEHVMIIAILHANVGTEVGAFFIQNFIEKFHTLYASFKTSESDKKQLENLVLLSSFMYHFKIVDSCLIYDLLNFLADKFTGKDVELILTIFRSVGFRLRKDNPVALKSLILILQQKASLNKSSETSSRINFMLEIILAIRNNNMNKIPNYDPSFGEHLLKTLKSYLHKGNYVSEMKISMEDLLNAQTKGRWWIVGSAWNDNTAGKDTVKLVNEQSEASEELIKLKMDNEKLVKKAKSMGMNTDTRRNIFCILMSAEDYLDAFEKLMKLGLKNQVERDIIHVIIYCCLQEKKFNPFYAFLVSKLCHTERRFILTTQYSLWDRLKDLRNNSTGFYLVNLSRFIVHLINEKSIPLAVLKILDFAEMDKNKLTFLKKTLSRVLLQKNINTLEEIFAKIAAPENLNLFRESLKLFMNHFLLKGEKELMCEEGGTVDMSFEPKTLETLKSRVEIAERAMSLGQSSVKC